AVDNAIKQLEESVPKIATVFATNPNHQVVNATYGSSQKIWQNKADFDSKIPPVVKAIADVKGKIKDKAGLRVAYNSINDRCNDCHDTYRSEERRVGKECRFSRARLDNKNEHNKKAIRKYRRER